MTTEDIIRNFLKEKRRKYVSMHHIEVDCRLFGLDLGVCHLPSTYKRTFNQLVHKESYEKVTEDARGRKFKNTTWRVN